MLSKLWAGPERRRFRRHEATIEVRIQVELYGFESGATPFFASGKTVNISRNGVLARLDAPVTRGAVCNVFFREARRHVRPQHIRGKIVRCQEHHGQFMVAVEFDAVLQRLELPAPATVAAKA